jgi:uncharacterized membrane protein YgcG
MKRFPAPRKLCLPLLLIAAAVPLLVGCGTTTVDSTWPKNEITANGKIGNWEGLINYSLSDQFGLGVANDDKYLYLCAVIEEQKIGMQILHNGLTAWFETPATKDKLFGIHFPLGNGIPQEFHHHRDVEEDTNGLGAKVEAACQQLEILGPGKNDSLLRNIALCEPYGIQLKFAFSRDEFIYEARIPLLSDSSMIYAVNPGKDSLLTLRIEVPAPEVSAANQEGSEESGSRSGGGMGGGGMGGGHYGGGGMGHQGGMGGGGFGGQRQQAQPIDAKFIIKLAGKPTK